VTVPDVAPLPLLFTVIVYVAPVCPCVKFPVCDFVMLRSGVPTLRITTAGELSEVSIVESICVVPT